MAARQFLPLFYFLTSSICYGQTLLIQKTDTINLQEYEVIYDTVRIVGDTIHSVDTISISTPRNNSFGYSAEFSFSMFYSQAKFDCQTEDNIQYEYKRQKAQKPLLCYSIGGNFHMQKLQHSFNIGVLLCTYREKQDYHSNSWVKYTSSYMRLDTVDTYYIIRGTDTSWVYITKENQHEKLDSILERNCYNTNSYYMQFPFIYGYNKEFKNFSLYYRAGFILDILVSTSGKTLSTDNNNEFPAVSKKDFSKVNISIWLGVALKLPVYNQFSLLIEPHYLKGLGSIYKSTYAISQKQQSFGLKCGLVYQF